MSRRVGRTAAVGLLCVGVVLSLSTWVLAASPEYRMRVRGVKPLEATLHQLRLEGFDIPFVDPKTDAIDVVGTDADRDKLIAKGFVVERIQEQLAPDQPDALSDYLSPAEIEARLLQFETAYPNLAKRVPYATEHEGRIAYAFKISDNVAAEEDEPALLFVSQHHAREVMTPEVTIDIIDQLLSNYGTDAEITRWVDSYEIWVLPSHNPDGANQVFTGNTNWRKNRRNNGDGSFGVDPNRNYPWQWGNTVCSGSDGATSSDTYHGPSAASEPATQGLINLAREQRPAIAVSYHTYSELALHPFGCSNEFPDNPDLQFIREMANEVSTKMIGDVPNTWYRFGSAPELLYEVDGEMSDWFYGDLGTVGVTFELNTSTQGFQPDYATWRNSTVQRARAGWRYFFQLLDRSRLTGHVIDACTGAPLSSTVKLGEITFTHNETPRISEPLHGRYEWFVRPGTYTLQVNRSGYRSQSWPTRVEFTPVPRDLKLVPNGSRGVAAATLVVSDPTGDGDGQADPGETLDASLDAYVTGESLTGLTATVTSADPYVTVLNGNLSFGAVAAGATATASGLQLQVAPGAPDQHVVTLNVAFAANESLCAPSSSLTLRITQGLPSCPFVAESLDTNPGWQIDNGSTAGGWAFGIPASAGVGGPNAAYTGSNVYGTNLSGTYTDSSDYRLVAGPYDLSSLRHTELRFARWLRSEPGYDIARVQVRLGATGAWNTAWEGFGRDTSWVPIRLDVSNLVDNESEVYVRFQLTSDVGTVDAGFYVDDLSFCGEDTPGVGGKVKYKSYQLDDSNLAYANNNGALDLNETVTLKIDVINSTATTATAISGILSSDTPGVSVLDSVADFPNAATGATVRSLAPHFTVRAGSNCGGAAIFRLTTRWNDGSRADSTFSVPIGQTGDVTVFTDDMETNKGWTAGGDARPAGLFVRANPNGVTDPTAGPVQPEDDTTATPGVTCWVTGNPPVGPGFDPKSGDVDRGTAFIESPIFDGRGTGSLLLRYSRWFHRSNVGPLNEGSYRARLSNDGGANYTDLESLSTNASAWQAQQLDVSGTLPRTNNMRMRFEATEAQRSPGDPLVELLIDDVSVTKRDIVCAPFTPGETKLPNQVGNSLLVSRLGTDVALRWTAPSVDGTHDAARFYPVFISLSPSSGFATNGEPTATQWRDADAAAAALGNRFYLVSAKNAAGTSGEEPTP
ncbi:MAG: M14 family zinc carboxypeptidase [Acidobacteriota bacterium]